MDFNEVFRQLCSSAMFQEWEKGNKNHYLSHLFAKLSNELEPSDWQAGFYNKDTEKIVSFKIEEEHVEKLPEDDVFKKEGHPQQLELDSVSTKWAEIKKSIKELQEKSYPAQIPASGFLILQHWEGNTIWNVTLVTIAFSALNIKVDAKSGDVVKHELTSFFDLRKT